MTRSRTLVLALLLPVLALTSCTAVSRLAASAFEKPRLTFKAINLRELSLGSATVDLVYTVENPNGVALSLAELDYRFSVEGHPVASGRPPNGLSIGAHAKADLTFPATFTFSELAPVVETFLTKDFAGYLAEGTLGLQTPVGVLRFPLRKEGQFEVPKIPRLDFQTPRVKELSFSGMSLELPVMVTNRNSYALPIGGLNGTVLIAGREVGTLHLPDLGMLQGHEAKPITLPLEVKFAEASHAVAALKGGQTTLGFSGTVTSHGQQIPVHVSQAVTLRP